jgi:hypothetical protein
MEEEFNWRLGEITSEMEKKKKPRSAQTHDYKGEEFFAKTWIWQWHVLRDKRAGGRVLRFFLMLAEADFENHYNKPFKVTSAMMAAVGIARKHKAELLRMFREWGFLFLDAPPDKNPTVFIRWRQGRGANPFGNST